MAQTLSTIRHPLHATFNTVWTKLRHVREGTGGFLDGKYLVAHPREWKDHDQPEPSVPTKKLTARRALACYENFASTIIDAMKTALFRQQAVRRVVETKQDTPLQQWWENVDGLGTHIDDFLQHAWDMAGTFGHLVLYVDTPAGDAPTAADQRAPFIRVYTPLDVLDWLVDDLGQVTAIKFAEAVPRDSLEIAAKTETRVRVVTTTGWQVFTDTSKTPVSEGEHQMGVLPVVYLYAQRRPMEPHVGMSVLGDPKLFLDLYNLTSEVRELLRNQTFGILNIPLGSGDTAMSVEQAQQIAGGAKGTDNALFSGLAAGFISPDPGNVAAYHNEITRRLRTIYRLASLSWEADSKDAEAEGSLKLKREDMHQRLSGYADELEKADYALTDLFYRATQGAEAGPTRKEKDTVQIKYPDTFDMTPFDEVIAQAEAALSLGLPAAFLKELRKRLYKKFDGMGDLPSSLVKEIDDAIDGAPDDLTPDEKAKMRVEATMNALKGQQQGPPGTGEAA